MFLNRFLLFRDGLLPAFLETLSVNHLFVYICGGISRQEAVVGIGA
jgi:hypothetical protein